MLIGLSDRTSHTFHPGDMSLVEDTTGKGHTTTIPDSPAIAFPAIAFIVTPED